MKRAVRLAAIGVTCMALLAACGSSSAVRSGTATPVSATPTSAPPTPTAVTTSEAILQAVYARLFPSGQSGGDCVGGTSSPSWAACPLTPRLVAALNAAISAQSGPGAEPLCGCQAFDPHQTATYSVGVPPGGGTIHVTGFGAPHVAYVVIPSSRDFLVDDIIYCTPSPHSIYPGEAVSSC